MIYILVATGIGGSKKDIDLLSATGEGGYVCPNRSPSAGEEEGTIRRSVPARQEFGVLEWDTLCAPPTKIIGGKEPGAF